MENYAQPKPPNIWKWIAIAISVLFIVALIYISMIRNQNQALKIEKINLEIKAAQAAIDTISAKEEETVDDVVKAAEIADKEAESLIKPLFENEKHFVADTNRVYKFGFITRK